MQQTFLKGHGLEIWGHGLTIFLPISFCPENVFCFLHLLQALFLIMEANTRNIDQTAPIRDIKDNK